MMSDSTGNLTDAALKRKERLEKLKRLKTNDTDNEDDNSSLPRPVFRNYQPLDEGLKENTLPKAEPILVDEQMKSHLENLTPEPLAGEVNLSSLAPRKPDWDLKRDVSKKLDKLEKRTQKAIITLIRERLLKYNEEQNDSAAVDLAHAVKFEESSQNTDSDDDD